MHPATKNLTGERFGRLVVLEYVGTKLREGPVWQCQCDCGELIDVLGSKLKRGDKRSCGCWQEEVCTRRDDANIRHPLYSIWAGMRGRCRSPKNTKYADYGGRGITIDPRWGDFAAFAADMGPRPSPQHSVDRVDNDGPYSPENCRWATPEQQAANQRCWCCGAKPEHQTKKRPMPRHGRRK